MGARGVVGDLSSLLGRRRVTARSGGGGGGGLILPGGNNDNGSNSQNRPAPKLIMPGGQPQQRMGASQQIQLARPGSQNAFANMQPPSGNNSSLLGLEGSEPPQVPTAYNKYKPPSGFMEGRLKEDDVDMPPEEMLHRIS